ncbi:MAG: exopolysaccharide biosynthesis polyprenyl glycosylphosphotransferase [Firmicutes bacterium]|nr:exopolysaccharide biosynthesis polyprenyl glycosylphosphotransferase [Bacillota bacterium]
MHTRSLKGWLKHGDFIIMDMLCLQLCFTISYWITEEFGNPYTIDRFQFLAVILLVCQLLVVIFANNYTGIIRRGPFAEVLAVIKQMLAVLLLYILFLFVIHQSLMASRLHAAITAVLYVVCDTLLRSFNKWRIQRTSSNEGQRSIVLVTSEQLVPDTVHNLLNADHRDFTISKILLMDKPKELTSGEFEGISMAQLTEATISEISHEWVDEVFVLQPDNMPFPEHFADDLVSMGITINYTPSVLLDERWAVTEVNKLGNYKVLTSSIQMVSPWQVIVKRAVDIVGGLVGCIFTGFLTLIIGPAIYLKSPGPIFFAQERIGKNGKTFKMYKFRSMYLDAEERKAALMSQNKIQSGLMFKMDDDPRIIGSEKKDKNGKPKGIGNFIRNTSLDEFPQFFNILKGDMSLVGTRPPTLDEWSQYDLGHRVRMSIKPGLTGMWQVSGRSEITDFEEVVRLDREYIQNWSLLLDLKILIKTVFVVFTKKGAE